MHRWAEVVARNDAGGCWVVMDGMVFDLEAWLPEHPGGATIIPTQALNEDPILAMIRVGVRATIIPMQALNKDCPVLGLGLGLA